MLFPSDCVSLAYQRVQKVECTSPRPVLILGPLTDPVKEMLVKESPGKFCRCVLGEFTSSRCLSVRKSESTLYFFGLCWTSLHPSFHEYVLFVLYALFMNLTLPIMSAEVMKASQQAIERGVKDCLFIDYKRRSGHFDVTTVASIKEITDKVFSQCLSFSSDFIQKDKVGSVFLFLRVRSR